MHTVASRCAFRCCEHVQRLPNLSLFSVSSLAPGIKRRPYDTSKSF